MDMMQPDPAEVRFDTRIAIVVRDDLPTWQKLNMTAFLASAVAAGEPATIGAPYEDDAGNRYLAMFGQPVLVFAADAAALRAAYDRAMQRGLRIALFTDALFATGHDAANRAAVRACRPDELALAGLAFRAARKVTDKVLKGVALHR